MITGVDAYIADRRKSFRFPRDIEAVFDEQRRGYRAKAMLSSVAPSIVCYNAFLPADWLLMPATARLATFEHVAVTGWFLVAALLFRTRPAFVVRELICVSMPILMVLQVLSIYVLGRAQLGASDYQYLAVMIVVYMNVNLRPDFRFALGSSLFLCSAYIAVLTTGHAAFSTEVVGIATMLAAVHLTLVANWRLERDARHSFLRRLQDRLHRERAEAEAGRDPLTGLFNRRHLDECAGALWRAAGPTMPMAALMIDVDHFKGYNDLYGHLAGDLCLKQVAASIASEARDIDVCVRFGGEEFVVLLPGADLGVASKSAERIRRVVENRAIVNAASTSGRVEVSVGVASGPVSTLALSDLISQADAALYAAKRNGRNLIWPPFVTTGLPLTTLSSARRVKAA